MDESTAVTYIGMSIDELSPYLDRLQASLLGVQQAVFAVGVVLSAWLLYSLFYICLCRCVLRKHRQLRMLQRAADGTWHTGSQTACHDAGLLP